MVQIDPVARAVIVNNLMWATEEMNEYLAKSAFSSNIKVRRDCSCALYTKDGDMLAQGTFVPVHLGIMSHTLKEVLKIHPVETLKKGDVLMHNDPYLMGSHLWDVMVFKPVFFENEIIAFTGCLAHQVDVGGSPVNYVVKTVYEEGIRFPGVKLVKEGELQEDILRIFTTNVRTPYEVKGDLMAEIAANNRGEERVLSLAEKYGREAIVAYFDSILDYSEAGMRKSIEALPDGVITYEDIIEGDGIRDYPIPIKVRLKIEGSDIYVDFDGSGPCGEGGFNNTWSLTLSGTYYGIKAVLGAEVPTNTGAYRAIHVKHPEGDCILDAKLPHAVGGCTTVAPQRIADVIIGAFSKLVPERCCACDGHWAAASFGGMDDRVGRYFSYVETYGCGRGAKHNEDGASGHQSHMTNTANAPTEIIEMEHPFIVRRYGLVENSGGAGEYRGGLGMMRELECLTDMSASIIVCRSRTQPYGLFGGLGGQCDSGIVIYPTGERRAIKSEAIPKGSIVRIQTAGGGGWGDPRKRDPKKLEDDVLNGFVSIEGAKTDYGAVIDPETGKIIGRSPI